jgi:subtilisin family serine protease
MNKKFLGLLGLSLLTFSDLNAQSSELKAATNWQNLDYKKDKIYGTSVERAYKKLKLKNKNTVIVAIIDSGVETDHPDLQANIWVNSKEIANNGKDDDNNGYIDDINGWDFLGNAKGEDIAHETLESTRTVMDLREKALKIDSLTTNPAEIEILKKYKLGLADLERRKNKLKEQGADQFIGIYESLKDAEVIIKEAFKVDKVTDDVLEKIDEDSSKELQFAASVFEVKKQIGMSQAQLDEAYEYFHGQLAYNLNLNYNPRTIIGDDPTNTAHRNYGNNEVEGPDAGHGTHVAGIIGAIRGNSGINGVASNVKMMAIRAVPDGDERDKDIANAIRYAVDNGAQIINMSFGKSQSPQKQAVDDAVRYAATKNVLMIHAAGNDGKNLDVQTDNFPKTTYLDGTKAPNWMEIGALSYLPGKDMVASFSNYGKNSVDLFAPGVDIDSCQPNGEYKENSGTSMAAPVVAGVAALILSNYPNLTAVQLKQILRESAERPLGVQVNVPESDKTDDFANLSETGGIVNAYKALVLAKKMSK